MISLVAALLLLPVPGAGIPAGGELRWEVDDPREVLLDLRMGRLARRLVPALELSGMALLPAGEFLELAEVRFSLDPGGRLRALRQPGDRPIRIDAPEGTVRLDGRLLVAEPPDIVLRGGRVYLAPRILEELFDVTIHTNWTELTAVILDPGHLPVGLRAAREARWRAFQGEDGRPSAERSLSPNSTFAGGMVLDWNFASSLRDPEGTAALSAGLGTRLLGGSLQVTTRSIGPVREGDFPVSATYRNAWPKRSWIRQARLGDGLSSGPHPRDLRGVHLTNAPYVRDAFFGTESFTGRLGPGWDVELRRHGRTLDVTRADEQGAFALDIPLSYGENPVEVVAFGPHGEIVTMDRLLLLRADRLPRGQVEWGLSAGECRDPRCLRSANLDLRYGLTRRWTVRAGAELFEREDLPRSALPYARVSAALSPPLQVDGDWVGGGFVRGTGFFTPGPDFRLRTAVTRFDRSVEAPVLHDPRRKGTVESDLFVRPAGRWSRWTLKGSMVHEEREGSEMTRWQALSSLRLGSVRLDGGVRGLRVERKAPDPEGGLTALAAVSGSLPRLSGGYRAPWFRTEIEVGEAFSLERVRARASHSLSRGTTLDAAASWSRAVGHQFTLSLTATLDQVRSVTQLAAQEGHPQEIVQYAQGAVRWNDAIGGFDFDVSPGLERSGLSGYVFLDENGNGRRDPGEAGLADVEVVVAGRTVRTDQNGRYALWDLVPFEAARVELSPRTIPDPTWVSLHTSLDVPLPPSSSRRLDLPVVRSGQVHGRVTRLAPGGREIPVPGVQLLLVDLQRGGRIMELTTFSDGGFYAMGLRPGGYELRLTPGILAGLGLEPDHPRRAVVVSPDGREPTSEVRILLVPIPSEP